MLIEKNQKMRETYGREILDIWWQTGVMCQTIFSTIEYHKPDELLVMAYQTVSKFNNMTGRYGIISVYAVHFDTPYPHVHVLQISEEGLCYTYQRKIFSISIP